MDAPSLHPPAGPPVLDREGLLERLGGDAALAEELVREYLVEAADAAVRLRAALGRGDLAALRREAHALRGVSANLGAVRVKEALSLLESAASAGCCPETAASLLARVESEIADVVAAARPPGPR